LYETTAQSGAPTAAAPSLTASIGKNTAFGVLASIVQVATRFVTIPVIIAHLGIGGYGIWAIIMTSVSYMRFGVFGLKSAFQKYVAQATASGDYRITSQLLSTGSAAMLAISAVCLIPVAFLSRMLARIIGVPQSYMHSAAIAIALLAVTAIVFNVGSAYDAIICGAHRVDLARKFNTVLSILEAVAVIVVLHLGFGIVAMAVIVTASCVIYISLCYCFSRAILPQVHINRHYVTSSVRRELIRFAGSYQLLNAMEMAYGTILPIAILRGFGARAVGVLALASRLTSPVMMCLYAFMVPMLSGGAMVLASRSPERMGKLFDKSFKVTLSITIIPLALICMFGKSLLLAWTGETDPRFPLTLCFVALAVLFQGFSLLGLVLYRASGRALVDNLREVLRIAILLSVVAFSSRIGFYGALAGLAAAEFVGMTFMLAALARTHLNLRPGKLLSDVGRFTASAGVAVLVAAAAAHIPLPAMSSARLFETFKVGVIGLAALITLVPALGFTRAVSKRDLQAVVSAFRAK
jgi:O-antigen/teichoic acid export membrane protein